MGTSWFVLRPLYHTRAAAGNVFLAYAAEKQ
jgi:hypothetical protein